MAKASAKSSSSLTESMETSETQVKLPAVRVSIDPTIAPRVSPISLRGEILRCKKVDPKLIKKAYIHDNIIVIATDDSATHAELQSPWPADAFGKGVRVRPTGESSTLKIKIKFVHEEVDLSDPEVIAELKKQGITEAERLKCKSDNKPSKHVLAKVTGKQNIEKIISLGVYIGWTRHSVEKAGGVVQCFKCQGIGHRMAECTVETKCVRCALNHHHSACPINANDKAKFLCANCGQNHAACSRECPNVKKASQLIASRSYASAVASATTPSRSYAAAVSRAPVATPKPSPSQSNIDDIINRAVQAAFSSLEHKINSIVEARMIEFEARMAEKIADTARLAVLERLNEIAQKSRERTNSMHEAKTNASAPFQSSASAASTSQSTDQSKLTLKRNHQQTVSTTNLQTNSKQSSEQTTTKKHK